MTKTYNLTATISLNTIDLSASIEANSLEEAIEKFDTQTSRGDFNDEIDICAKGLGFDIDVIEED